MNSNNCPSFRLLKFFGKKWTLMILRVLQDNENIRFNEFTDELDGISPKTLSDRLKEFRRYGIVEKKTYNEVPPRTEYRLTEKGKDLIDCFRCMDQWAKEHDLPA